MGELQRRLQQAARHVAQLVKEKQQLLELSNKLRAELNQAGKNLSLVSSIHHYHSGRYTVKRR